MTGLGQLAIGAHRLGRAIISTGERSTMSRRSAPAAKTVSPPVMMMQRVTSSAPRAAKCPARSSRTEVLSALRTWGRLRRTTAIPSARVSRRTSVMFLLWSAAASAAAFKAVADATALHSQLRCRSGQQGHSFSQCGEALVIGLAAHVARVDLLDDHGELEDGEDFVERE